MDKYKKLGDLLSSTAVSSKSIPLLNAEVLSIEGESCTVKIDDLQLTDVRLKATINGSINKIIITPVVGSMVLIGSLTGDLKDLAVLKADEIAKFEYEQNGLKIIADSSDSKVSIENDAVSVKNIFQSLVDLLKQFKVYTPTGPSGTALPDIVLLINQFETDFKSILK